MQKTPERGNHTMHRRALVRLAMVAPLAGLAAAAAGPARAQKCVAADDLSPSELSLRTSLKYEEPSTDPAKLCTGCAFYTAEDGGCGQCKLLNGPVAGAGRCASWAAKPA